VAQAKTSQESQRGPVVTDSDFFDQPPAPKPAAEGPVSSATPSVPPVKPVAPGMTSETQALPRLDPAQWAWVPPGSFVMGSPNTEKERVSDEGPQTHVTFAAGFWIAKHEASQAEYEAVIGENPSQFKGDPRLPVERVSWHDATNYCARLTERERAAGRLPANLVYRLPTEAEWEYVCRAGTDTAFHQGAALRSGMANFDGRYEYDAAAGSTAQKPGRFLGRTAPVGSYPPNAWGFHDFHGNVWEWCLDWYSNARTGGRLTDPVGPATGLIRVMRGGSWANVGSNCRAAVRGADKPERKGSDLGFRVVLGPAR
jgi:formylglycine-generating enzyme required for sulfatase activity